MPLPLPTLDNRTFAELTAEGRALLPRLAPGWTDHNVHDPGITLLELFAWLVEMDIYQLDLIPDASRRAFLRLVGIELRPPGVAATVATFSTGSVEALSPGTPLTDASGAMRFETTRGATLTPARLLAVQCGREVPARDLTAVNVAQTGYRPFGALPEVGVAWFLGFDQPLAPAGGEISLWLWTPWWAADQATRDGLIAEWTDAVAELGNACVPSWTEHYSVRTAWEYRTSGGAWASLADVVDETRALTLSGPVRFRAPADQAVDDGFAWIRCRYVGGHYECAPEVLTVAVNAVPARHAWHVPEELLGRSSGGAGQQFQLRHRPVVAASLELQVATGAAGHGDWREVPHWDLVSPHDRAVVLEPTEGLVTCGNGRTARVPPAGATLRCRYRTGGGTAGNVPAGTLSRCGAPGVVPRQPFPATGGTPAETLPEAHARALRHLAAPSRAVTLADLEALALATPGVPVARARALADFHPAAPCYAAAGNVTVVVVPRCPDPRPEPGPDFLRAVRRHVDRRRLLGTHLHVIGPDYTLVVVHARLHATERTNVSALRIQAESALAEFFHPLRGGPERTGWPVGRDVYRSEVLAVLGELPGVDHVDPLGLAGDAESVPRCGDLRVCPHYLIASGPHRLEVVERKS